MSANIASRIQTTNLAKVLLCVGTLMGAGCAAEGSGPEDEVPAETQQQVGTVTRNPIGGVTRTPVTPQAPATPLTPVRPPPIATPSDQASPTISGPVQRCVNLAKLELATCQQSWSELPGGRARLNLGGGLQEVRYKLIGVGNREAIIQGDIIVGDEASISEADGLEAAARISRGLLWPEGRIPYEIDPDLPDANRVAEAIKAWHAVSPIRFVPWNKKDEAYVRFIVGPGCSSSIGRVGKMQTVKLRPSCKIGNVIHELGHAIGLWHEQARLDRDNFVEIHWENIKAGEEDNFATIAKKAESGDVNGYNFGSIMHYPLDAFSIDEDDPTKKTISVRPGVKVPAGVVIGQRDMISIGDIAAVKKIYCEAFGGALCI